MDSKTTKHTPGPWEWGDLPGGRFTNELVVRPAGEFPHGEWIADVGSRYDDERRANAALIAAAPDLLAALLDAKAALEYAGMDEHTMEAYDRICAAINKATGEA